MKQRLLRIYCTLTLAFACVLGMTTPALAATPMTGDNRGQFMGIVIGVLVVSVILIIVVVAMGKKKK